MPVPRPTLERLRAVAGSLSMHLSDDDLVFFLEDMPGALDSYDRLDSLPNYLPEVRSPHTPGYRPREDQNPLSAWYVRTEIRGPKRGKLAGRTVAIKYNIAVAGVR